MITVKGVDRSVGASRPRVEVIVRAAHRLRQAPLFELALKAAGVAPEEALMVGDRAAYDGGAVSLGVPTLLLPPLMSARHKRLHMVRAAASRPAG